MYKIGLLSARFGTEWFFCCYVVYLGRTAVQPRILKSQPGLNVQGVASTQDPTVFCSRSIILGWKDTRPQWLLDGMEKFHCTSLTVIA